MKKTFLLTLILCLTLIVSSCDSNNDNPNKSLHDVYSLDNVIELKEDIQENELIEILNNAILEESNNTYGTIKLQAFYETEDYSDITIFEYDFSGNITDYKSRCLYENKNKSKALYLKDGFIYIENEKIKYQLDDEVLDMTIEELKQEILDEICYMNSIEVLLESLLEQYQNGRMTIKALGIDYNDNYVIDLYLNRSKETGRIVINENYELLYIETVDNELTSAYLTYTHKKPNIEFPVLDDYIIE